MLLYAYSCVYVIIMSGMPVGINQLKVRNAVYRFEAGFNLLVVELFLSQQEEMVSLSTPPSVVNESSVSSAGVVLSKQAL